MSNQNEHESHDRIALAVPGDIELEEYVAPPESQHHDQFAHYTHELTEDAADASTRALVRIVPVAYGGLLGGLAESLALGLALGLALSMMLDLTMGSHSMMRALWRATRRIACSGLSRAARWLARGIACLRLRVPPSLAALQCNNRGS